jgi:hypothetical protein
MYGSEARPRSTGAALIQSAPLALASVYLLGLLQMEVEGAGRHLLFTLRGGPEVKF